MTLRQWRAFDRFSEVSSSSKKKRQEQKNIDEDLLFSVVWLYTLAILLGISVFHALLLNSKTF